jgi:hypothetical protein
VKKAYLAAMAGLLANIWRISRRRRRNRSIINGRGNDENVRQKVMAGGVVRNISNEKSAKSVIQLTVNGSSYMN